VKIHTPVVQIDEKDQKANTAALEELLNHLPDSLKYVVDVRYGLGQWAQVISVRFPKADILGFELDRETALRAQVPSRCRLVFEGDLSHICGLCNGTGEKSKVDLLLADFNMMTLTDPYEVKAEIFRWNPRWFVFTDVACGKLHLNWKTYGLGQPDLNLYWESWQNTIPYQLVAWSRKHHFSSSALFTKLS
jgi:hypothetical protein